MHKLSIYLILVFVLIGCSVEEPTHTPMNKEYHSYDEPTIESSIKQEYIEAINAKRAKEQDCGKKGKKPKAPALKWSDALYRAAYEHSQDLAKSNTFAHEGSGTASDWTAVVLELGRGSTFKERSENNGYEGWKSLGENVAKGQRTVDEVISSWMGSPGHCANIMNPDFTEVGMAQYEKEGTVYWTQNFGAK
jgi:uncharacterized protein YkwD